MCAGTSMLLAVHVGGSPAAHLKGCYEVSGGKGVCPHVPWCSVYGYNNVPIMQESCIDILMHAVRHRLLLLLLHNLVFQSLMVSYVSTFMYCCC